MEQCIVSKVWKKIVLIFLYTLSKARRKSESSFSHSCLAVFPSLAMQQISSFFKQGFFLIKKKMLMRCWFSSISCSICTITHDPRSEYNGRKVSVASVNRAGGVWGCSETPAGSLRKFLGSKDHLNWLKIDFNAAEIISIITKLM